MLQTRTIFTNVSKGVLAKEKDLEEAFGTTDAHAICLEILKKGDLPSHMTAEYASYFWAISDGRSACSSASSRHCCRALRSLNMKFPDSLNAFSIAVSILDWEIQKIARPAQTRVLI